jgi:6,7-dimethyl-8-ribityllumazine synthase
MRIFTDETRGRAYRADQGRYRTTKPVLVRMHALDPLLKTWWAPAGPARPHGEFGARCELIAEEGRGRAGAVARPAHEARQRKRGVAADLAPIRAGCADPVIAGPDELILLTNSPEPEGLGLDAYGLEIVGTRRSSRRTTETDGRRKDPLHPAAPGLRQAREAADRGGPYYRDIADNLIAGARAEIEAAGGTRVVEVPGALEMPTAIAWPTGWPNLMATWLGCVIRGETTHYDTVCNDSSRGLMLLGLQGLCIGNGILTVETRAGRGAGRSAGQNKGGGAAAAALHLIAVPAARRGRGQSPGGDRPDDRSRAGGEMADRADRSDAEGPLSARERPSCCTPRPRPRW